MKKLKKEQFESPRILSVSPVRLEKGILQGSIVESIQATETTGHEVANYDWSLTDPNGENVFNHNWR